MPTETFIPKNSSNVSQVDYNPETQTMTIEFSTGGTYQYSGVTPDKFVAMQTAESVGGYIHRQIKNRHQTSRVA